MNASDASALAFSSELSTAATLQFVSAVENEGALCRYDVVDAQRCSAMGYRERKADNGRVL